MVCLGLEPGAEGWKAQTNPLSYGGTPNSVTVFKRRNWTELVVGSRCQRVCILRQKPV